MTSLGFEPSMSRATIIVVAEIGGRGAGVLAAVSP